MAQLKNKFIENASGSTKSGVTDDKIRLQSTGYLRSRNAANSADVNLLRLNGSDIVEFPSVPQIASGTPTNANDIATVQTVTNAINGIKSWKPAARAVFVANTALTGLGTSLTVDGVSLANNDRVVLSAQTTASQNGIYVVSGVGTAVVLTLATDWVTGSVVEGTAVLVIEGTAYAKSEWLVTTTGTITVGSTSVTIVQVPSGGTTYSGGDMITVTGSVITADLSATGGLSSTNPGNAAGQLQVNVNSNTLKIATNTIEGTKPVLDSFTLIAGDITNQFVDLTQVAESAASIKVVPIGGPEQTQGTDYTVNLTGGTGGKTRISFAGDLATGGGAALVATDILKVEYRYL